MMDDDAPLDVIDDAVGSATAAVARRQPASFSRGSAAAAAASTMAAPARTKIVFCDTSDDDDDDDADGAAVDGNSAGTTRPLKCTIAPVLEEYNLTTDHEDLVDEEAAAIEAVSAGLCDGALVEDSVGGALLLPSFPLPPLMPSAAAGAPAAPLRFRTVEVENDEQLQPSRRVVAPRSVKTLAEATATRKRFREKDGEEEDDDALVVEEEVVVAASNAILCAGDDDAAPVVVLPVRVVGNYNLTLDEAELQDDFEDAHELLSDGPGEEKEHRSPQAIEAAEETAAAAVSCEPQGIATVPQEAGDADGNFDDAYDDDDDDDEDEEDDELDDLIAVAAIEQMRKCCEAFLHEAGVDVVLAATPPPPSSATATMVNDDAPVETDATVPASASLTTSADEVVPPVEGTEQRHGGGGAGGYTFTAFRRFLQSSGELLEKYAAKQLTADELTHLLSRDVFHVQRAFQRLSKPPKDAPIIINGVRMDM